jgi:hypothetical protein
MIDKLGYALFFSFSVKLSKLIIPSAINPSSGIIYGDEKA